jgi:hypothetical protein
VETASIKVSITPMIELENAGLYSIFILTYGDYIHDELVEKIKESCTFDWTRVGDELVYTCDYTTFMVSYQDLHNAIFAYPNFQQIPADSPIRKEMKEMNIEDMEVLFMKMKVEDEEQ